MARVNRKVAPYYDDYDSSKQYTQILAVPGRVAQAREITQLQSTIKDIVKSIGDSIMKDGNVIEGCQVIINSKKTEATVTAGKVYLDGMVLPVEDTTVEIEGTGTETIGFRLMEMIITESEDPTLRDPAQGFDNFNQPGCHRIKSTVAIVRNDPDSSILATLIDGDISVERYAPEYDSLTKTLATRTYEESGSYIVDGFKVRMEENSDPTKVTVVVEAGTAYIEGFRVKIPSSRRIPIGRSLSSSDVIRRSKYYETDELLLSTGPYVKEIISVEGYLRHTISNMVAPPYNTAVQSFDLPTNAIKEERPNIHLVSVGGGLYKIGTDCDLDTDGNIKWLGTSNYPTGSYALEFEYIAKFEEGTDYELVESKKLSWVSGGIKPLSESEFIVKFSQYLARKDLVCMNKYGEISVIEGTPAVRDSEVNPETPLSALPLAYLSNPPGGTYNQILVSNVGLTRFTMNDIQNLLQRVRNLEYEQTLLSLQDDGRQRTVSGTKKSIFTDPLVDFSKIDYYYNLLDGVKISESLPVYDATIDLDSNICYLPVVSHTYDLEYDSSSTTTKYDRLITLPKTSERVILSQMNATKVFQVNPYSTFPQLPEIGLSPAADSWIEDSFINIPVSQSASEIVSTSSRHLESTVIRGGSFQRYSVSSSTSKDTQIGTRKSTSITESVLSEQASTYIRSREITITGGGFPAELDNIHCYFDGVKIPLTPITGSAGTEEGSVKTSSNGSINAKFTIPEKTFLTGIREVRLETSTPGYGVRGTAFALYQAIGTDRTIQRTVTTLTTILLNRVTTVTTTTFIDPVGQTFVLDRMSMISGIDVYFASAPGTEIPVTCDIREVVNGSITSTILGHKTLSAATVRTKIDSDKGMIPTRFSFDDPVLLEENKEYAFVIRSTSSEYNIWVADLGEIDRVTEDPVVSNPYLIGVMMSSSNNSSWTTHQTMDIKFRLVSDVYAESGEMIFSEVTPPEAYSRAYLIADSIIPEGTSVDWMYSIDSGKTWLSIAPYNIKLFQSMHQKIKIKAKLSRKDNANLSPLLASDSASIALSYYDTEGEYISLTYPGNSYNKVDIILDTYTPSGTLKVYVSADNGTTLIEATSISSTPLDYGWEERIYRASMTSSSMNCKIFIKMSSNNKYSTPAFSRLRAINYTE